MFKERRGNMHFEVIFAAIRNDAKPLHGRRFRVLFAHTGAPPCVNGPRRAPRPQPDLAVLTLLLFRGHAQPPRYATASWTHDKGEFMLFGQNAAAPARRPAGFHRPPRLFDPRGSRRHGGGSETRPRVKPARAPRRLAPDFEYESFPPLSKERSFRRRFSRSRRS
jgi:hypothetical protein